MTTQNEMQNLVKGADIKISDNAVFKIQAVFNRAYVKVLTIERVQVGGIFLGTRNQNAYAYEIAEIVSKGDSDTLKEFEIGDRIVITRMSGYEITPGYKVIIDNDIAGKFFGELC